MNNINMYEINSEIEDLMCKLAKKIKKLNNKKPERLECIKRGIKLIMKDDVDFITSFFDECMKVDDSNADNKVKRNIAYDMAIEDTLLKKTVDTSDDETEKEITGLPWTAHMSSNINNTDDTLENISNDDTMEKEESESDFAESQNKTTKKSKRRTIKRRRLSNDEIETISMEIAEHPNDKTSVMVGLLAEKHGILIPPTSFFNIRSKVVHKHISDKYFKCEHVDGKMVIVPVVNTEKTMDNCTLFNKRIAIKKASGEQLTMDELEFLIKQSSHNIRRNNVPDIYNDLNHQMVQVQFSLIEDVLNGRRNNLSFIDVWREEENESQS